MVSVSDVGGVREDLERLKRLVKRYPSLANSLSFLIAIVERYINHSGSTLAGAISYYIFLSLFPILILTVSVLGFVTADYGMFYETIIDSVAQVIPGYVSLVERNLGTISRNAGSIGFVALASLLWVSTGIFTSIEFSLNQVFEVREYKSVLHRGLLSIASVFFLACFILASTLITPVKGVVAYYLSYLPLVDQGQAQFLVGFVLTFLPFVFSYFLFYTIYRFIPAKRLNERAIVAGAALAAVVWEVTKNVLVWYLTARTAYYELIYGSLVLIVVSILWSYVFSIILVAASCFTYELHVVAEKNDQVDPRR